MTTAPLIGATYLHAPSGRPITVMDHEYRRPRADGGRSRTGRVVVRYADVVVVQLLVAHPRDLLDQLVLPHTNGSATPTSDQATTALAFHSALDHAG